MSINIADLIAIAEICMPQLVVGGIIILLSILTIIFCWKLSKPTKFMVRCQAALCIPLAIILVINLICCGPMKTMLNMTDKPSYVSEQTGQEAEELCTTIAGEGIVLLKNEDQVLPLAQGSNINVFGWASTNPCYGGTGSGMLSPVYPVVSLLDGLANAGFQTNAELSDFYTSYRADRPPVEMAYQDWTLPEPAADTYPSELLSNAEAFSDTALVVITRVGGEMADLPKDVSAVTYTDNSADYQDFAPGEHYLQLSQSERNMVELVCDHFDKVIVIYNGANAMELGFVNEYPQIKGVLWCPGPGQTGFNSLGKILSGEINPSGRTADTFAADLTKAPYYNNIGLFEYDNMDEFMTEFWGITAIPSFVRYVEGIYVGYRYYETAAAEGFIDYEESVVFPFGYGLSYTTFTQQMGELKVDADGGISFDVTVTNTGSTAGKDVVEVYYNPPYTNGGIEKASANLVTFDKTELLAPGASETITISFNQEDMASYDANGAGCYVLEQGDYVISINSDSHTVLDSKIYTVSSDVVYGEGAGRNSDDAAAVNQFDDAAGDVTYLSRKDGFANFAEATAAPASYTLSDTYKNTFVNNSNYDYTQFNDPNQEMPTTGANNGMKLAQLRGADYDDPRWETLLDQLTVKEMRELIATAGYQTAAISSVGKYASVDCDGPAALYNNFTGSGSIGFPSAVIIASTWSQDLARQYGESIGKMGAETNMSGWYAPAMNTHRSPFSGRNFEYYSEDGLLAGKIGANAVAGAAEYGIYSYIKHFALNDQETNCRSMLCTWSNEQAIREIYLKPFELSVKEGGATAVMSSFNFIGTTYAGNCENLLKHVLRDEWGFRGMVLTDYFAGYGFQNADQLIRAGNDAMLATYDTGTNYVVDTKSATSIQAMRDASHNIMYTVVNSRVYDENTEHPALLQWQITCIIMDVVTVAVLAGLEVLVIRGYKKRKAAAIQIENGNRTEEE